MENTYKIHVETIVEDVIDKVRGLIDLLFSVSTGIEDGLTPCDSSVALLAEITQEIECDLKEILQIDDSDNCHNDTSLEKWCEELINIFKRLDWVDRAEVLVYADKMEKKALDQERSNTSAEDYAALTAPATAEVELPIYLMRMAELRGTDFSAILQRRLKKFCGITD